MTRDAIPCLAIEKWEGNGNPEMVSMGKIGKS